MVWLPAALGVYVTEQLALAPLPERVHDADGVNAPAPLDVNVTVPVGVVGVPAPVSVTVAVHVVDWPTATVAGTHPTVVLVGRCTTAVTTVLPELPACVVSPPYVAVIVCGPAALGVYVTEQLALGPLPDSVQLVALKVPVPLVVKLTVPVGVVLVPVAVSVTVAVHVVEPPRTTVDGAQLTVVLVDRLATVTVVDPSLPLWFASPAYDAVIVCVPVPTESGV
jgi:hypothetical protein